MRDAVRATIGFEQLALELEPNKSLPCMLGTRGNLNTANFFAFLGVFSQKTGVKLNVKAI